MVYKHVVSFYAHVNNVFLCFSNLNAVSAISHILTLSVEIQENDLIF